SSRGVRFFRAEARTQARLRTSASTTCGSIKEPPAWPGRARGGEMPSRAGRGRRAGPGRGRDGEHWAVGVDQAVAGDRAAHQQGERCAAAGADDQQVAGLVGEADQRRLVGHRAAAGSRSGSGAVRARWTSAAMPMAMNARNCGNGNAPRNAAYWPSSRNAAVSRADRAHLGSARVRRIAMAMQPSAAGASRAKYAVARPSAQCWTPRYQPGRLGAPSSVLATDSSYVIDARPSALPTRYSDRPTRAVSVSRVRARISTAASPATMASVISQVEANHAVRCADPVAMAAAVESPQVGRIGGSRTPATKNPPDMTNRMPMAR